MAAYDRNRLLVQGGFKHFRRTYSLTEVRWGVLVLTVLVAIAAWVWWRGKHPPDDLYASGPLTGKSQASTPASRGPLPTQLAPAEWTERGVASFDKDNLYEKINGRADFFLSKGFVRLYAATLVPTDGAESVIDIELYDMGSPQGALAAFSAEKKEGVDVQEKDGGQFYRSRNATFLIKGKLYGRAIGSSESAAIKKALDHVQKALFDGLEGSDRPWAYALFVEAMGLDSGKVTFVATQAFSIEGADALWVAAIEGETELFVSAAATDEAAAAKATLLVEGFASYGTKTEPQGGVQWVADEFLGTLATARPVGRLVVGVRGAPDTTAGRAALERIEKAARALPAAELDRATRDVSATPSEPTSPAPTTNGEDM